LAKDLQELTIDGTIEIEEVPWVSAEGPQMLTVYSLTKNGIDLVEKKILPKIDPDTRTRIKLVAERYNNVSLDKLLSYVYSKYAQ